VLQCVAVCRRGIMCHRLCSVLQCVAVCCSVLQCVAVCCSVSTRHHVPSSMHCDILQHTAKHGNTLQQHTTRNTLQHMAAHCNALQRTATHCTTLEHTRLDQLHKVSDRVIAFNTFMPRRLLPFASSSSCLPSMYGVCVYVCVRVNE